MRKPSAAQPSAASPIILGVDPSLNSTGYAYRDPGGVVRTGRIEAGKLTGPWRLHYVSTELEKVIERVKPDIAVYEDYAMGKGKQGQGLVFHIGEMGGVLKRALWHRGVSIHLVSNTTMKKFVTGKGNPGFTKKGVTKLTDKQKKALISAALEKDFGLSVWQNDEADAAGLLLLGEAQTGILTIPETPIKSARTATLREVTVLPGKLQSISNR